MKVYKVVEVWNGKETVSCTYPEDMLEWALKCVEAARNHGREAWVWETTEE